MGGEPAKSVTEYQANRMAGAPRRWTYWVALFTAVNGILLLAGQDLTFLAGLVAPFVFDGSAPHFIAAAVFAALAYASSRARWILIVPLVLYIADTALSAYFALWAGVVMHAIVLGLVAISMAAGHRLNAQLSSRNENVA